MIELAHKNIKLRALESEDLEFLFQTENDTSLWEVSGTQVPFSKYILKQYLANSHQDIYEAKQLRLVIEYEGLPIGMLDLFAYSPQHQRAGVGIVIVKKYQNKGVASVALKLFIKYAFTTLHLRQLYAQISVDNLQSKKLFIKQNFQLIGIKKDWIFHNNIFKDVALYQLINNTN